MGQEQLEMDKLINEATQALTDLVKSEKVMLEEELKKSQAAQAAAATAPAPQVQPAPAAAPAAQAVAPVKKAEGSGYENMSPEASGSSSSSSSGSPASSAGSAPASIPAPESSGSSGSSGSGSSSSGSGSPDSSGSSSSSGSSDSSSGSSDSSSGSDSSGSSGSDEDHIGQMLSELDDDRLQHLYMKAKAELMARMHRDESPSQPQEQPMGDQNAMAMSEKVKDLEDKLAKSEVEKENLKKACGAVLDMTDKLTRRPVKKAVTDVKIVSRGDGSGEPLTKTEGMSDGELKKHINDISKDYNKLSKFSSNDRLTFIDYSAGRAPREAVVKILSK